MLFLARPIFSIFAFFIAVESSAMNILLQFGRCRQHIITIKIPAEAIPKLEDELLLGNFLYATQTKYNPEVTWDDIAKQVRETSRNKLRRWNILAEKLKTTELVDETFSVDLCHNSYNCFSDYEHCPSRRGMPSMGEHCPSLAINGKQVFKLILPESHQ